MATESSPDALRSGAFEDLRRIWRIDDTTLDRLKDLRPITDEVLFLLDERFYRCESLVVLKAFLVRPTGTGNTHGFT